MTNGDLPLAYQIAALPLLVEVCQEVAKEPYPDSDPNSLLETLRHRAQLALQAISNPANNRSNCPPDANKPR